MRRVRVRPSKPASTIAMIVAIFFVAVGLFVLVPLFGLVGGRVSGSFAGFLFGGFALLWTLVAAAIAVSHGMNVFSKRGVASFEIETDNALGDSDGDLPFDERLRRLEQLRQDGLVTQQEYLAKRDEIVRGKW